MPKSGSRKPRKKKPQKSRKRNWDLVADEETIDVYSNIALVRSGETDFIIDFATTAPEYVNPGNKRSEFPVDVRIHMSALFVPKLLDALQAQMMVFKTRIDQQSKAKK